MSDVTTTVDAYLAMWNETDTARRARLVEQAWAPSGRYVDPVQEAEGHAAIGDMVAGVHTQFPGYRFRRLSGVDVHHDQLRFAWDLAGPDGTVAVAGIDVGELATDGRLNRISGFFGDLPQPSAA
jgi:SnoaL-like domain